MTQKQILDEIAKKKEQMRSIIDTAEVEKRNLTEDEKVSFEAFNDEKNMLLRKLEVLEDPKLERNEEIDIRSIFAKNLAEAISSGNRSAKIEVRANIPINTADVADTIPVLFKDVLDVLQPKLVINAVGVKMQTNVMGTPVWPIVGDVEAEVLGENAELTDKSINFDKISATPKRAGVTIRLSRRAINQSNLNLYDIVVEKIASSIAMLLNKWLINPTSIASGCDGVFKKLDTEILPLSKKPFLEDVVGLETAVFDKDVNGDKGLYVIGTAMRGRLKTSPIASNHPAMILTGDEMNGYPVVTSNLIPNNYIGFGFFEYAVISQFGEFNLVVDPYTLATKNEIRFTGNSDYDITVLRPEAFALGKVVTASTIYSSKSALAYGDVVKDTTKDIEIVVKGINLTADISAALSGTNAAKFSLSSATFTKDGNGKVDATLIVTFAPTTTGAHTATLTLSSTGATNVALTITGKGTD